MRESKPGSSRSHRLALQTLDTLMARRARMASLFERMHDPAELRFGDIDRLCQVDAKRFLIVTADDFGRDEDVNEAVEQASRSGVLTVASLRVGAPAAGDAVRRAWQLPCLRVGLHLDTNGYMDQGMFLRSFRYFAVPHVRRQLEAEIRAQFESFARTGLRLDHVNVHKHFHLHPTLLGMILRIGQEFGMSAVRLPHEPRFAAGSTRTARARAALLRPWLALMRRRLRAAGLFHTDRVFGIAANGFTNEVQMLNILRSLPAGVTEIYLHPARRDQSPAPWMSPYRHADELAALLSPRVREQIAALQVDVGGYADAQRARLAAFKAHPGSDRGVAKRPETLES